MGDTTFVNGGIVTSNSTLVVKLQDASGINISNYGIGRLWYGVLDDEPASFALSEYFTSETDDFTKGWVYFPVSGLTPGKHTITVRAWDTYNNPSLATIDFIVTDGEESCHRNTGEISPIRFDNETKIYFTHNRVR